MGFSPQASRLLRDLAATAMPAGRFVHAGGARTVDRVDALFARETGTWSRAFEGLLLMFQLAVRARSGRSFGRLGAEKRLAVLHSLFEGSTAERMLVRALLSPLKLVHWDDPELFARLGCVYRQDPLAEEERPRYMDRAIDAETLGEGELIEAEVVVVGSGAGGAAVAAELAEMGLAVVLLEEGDYFRRRDFTGRPWDMIRMMYRNRGASGTVGNCAILIPTGRCVGGTTTINSGTCFRVPDRVLTAWRTEHGLADFTPERMDPFYAKVESIIQAAPADPQHVGGIATVMARGCEALGYHRHGPLLRNAPDCDGASLCCFGCPTDAKRSTNVSYVPLALRYGANLIYKATVERILIESGRIAGVEARASAGEGRCLAVRAPVVVLATGSLMTPVLLQRQGLANSSRQVGCNLSIHPAVGLFGLFSERIQGCCHIPQGYGIEQFIDEGLLFEGAFVPPDTAAASVTFFGPRFTEVMERFANVGYMGLMIEDTSRGRVRAGPTAAPLITYFMNRHDVSRIKRGLEILMRIFLAAGAETVFPQLPGFVEISDMRDVERFRRAKLRARDYDLTAHHPLGTARMGLDPKRSVVEPTHECHDQPGLFICDGSAVPSSIGVNPMMTIMAMATRAARFVARRAEEYSS